MWKLRIIWKKNLVLSFTTGGSGNERRMVSGMNKGKNVIPTPSATCHKCGKALSGECRLGLGTCFKCGQPSHMIWDYPKNMQGGGVSNNNNPN